MARAVQLHPVVAGVPHLVRTRRRPIEIGPVSDQVLRRLQGRRSLRRDQGGVAGPEAKDDKLAHRARCRPGTSTSEKYGAADPASAIGTSR